MHKPLLGNMLILLSHAQHEAEVLLGIWIQIRGAEFDDIAQAFRRAMFAAYAIVWIGGCTDVGYIEVRFRVGF